MMGVYSVVAEEIEFLPCSRNTTILQQCTINKVYVNPCPEARAAEPEPCQLPKGTNSTVVFDFTPNFESKSLSAQAYSETFLIDLPMPGQDTNACHFTSCPTVPGKKQTFAYTLEIKDYYPEAEYTSKWKLWNENDEVCCFKTKIKIVSV